MKKSILSFLALCLFQVPIYSQLKNYNDEGKVKIVAEKATLFITGVNARLTSDEHVAGLAVAAGTILAPVIDLAVNTVKEQIKKNALAYKGEFKCATSGERFYLNSDFASLPKLTVKRIIKTIDGVDKDAVEIELVPQLSEDKTAFRYAVKDKLVYNYSIAKTTGNYDYIDLNLEIKLKTLAVNKEEYKVTDLRAVTVFVPMIHVGKTTQLSEAVYSGWIPLPLRSDVRITKSTQDSQEDKSVIKTNKDNVKETTKEETIITKHKVLDYEKMFDSTGLYEIEVVATETNPYKIKAEDQKQVAESSSASANDILKALLKTLTTEKDKK